MDGLTRFGIQKSRLTILVMIGVLLIGLMTYTQLPKRENPALTIRAAVVTVVMHSPLNIGRTVYLADAITNLQTCVVSDAG